MRKSNLIIVSLLTVFAAVLLLSNVSAISYLEGIGNCNASTIGQIKTLTYNNGCGSGNYKCGLYRGDWLYGYNWVFQSCVSTSQAICCGSSDLVSCGYAYPSRSCGPCKTCDWNGTCGTNRPEGEICQDNGSKGYCGQGNCALDTASPYFLNHQGNFYIKNAQDIKNSTFDIDFVDDVKLKEYTLIACDENSYQYFVNRSDILPAPIFEGNCGFETFQLGGVTGELQNWNISREMWDWILERIANQGKVSVKINLTDGVDNRNNSDVLFNIVNDYTKPQLNVSSSSEDVPGGHEVTITAKAFDMLGETRTDIFIDGSKVKSECVEQSCKISRVYAEGTHSYYAFTTDPSGNNVTSAVGSFSFTQTVPTCSDSLGEICGNGTVCSENVIETSDTDMCCVASCNEVTPTLPTCSDQNGSAFNPSTDICGGNEVAADGLASPLRCCVGTLSKIPQVDRLKVSWTNADGAEISSASLQDKVNCDASGLIAEGEMTVTKDGTEISRKSVTLPSSSQFLMSEVGSYECDVQIGGKSKTATLSVIEVTRPGPKTTLPVFGFFNIIATLGIIFAYYFYFHNKK